jgi:hypothetical protein
MFEANVEAQVPASADRTWRVLSNFGDISWVPGMGAVKVQVHGNGPGMQRIVPGPTEPCVEQLDAIDHQLKTMRYSFVSGSPFPVRDFTVDVAVEILTSSKSKVSWQFRGNAAGVSEREAEEAMYQFYSVLAGWLIDELSRKN